MTDAKTCARCAGAGVLVIDFVDGHCPDCEDGYEVPFNRLTDLGQALRQRDEALAELRASQAECKALKTEVIARGRQARYTVDAKQAIEERDEARAKLAEAVELLRAYNVWAGTRELSVDERARLMHAVTVFFAGEVPRG